MTDLLDIDQYLNAESLTWSEILLAAVTILVALLVGRWLRRRIRTSLESRDGEYLLRAQESLLARLGSDAIFKVE